MGYIKGKKYKWSSRKGTNVLHLGCLLDNYECRFDSVRQNLSISNLAYSNDEVFNFKCINIESAEIIVKSFSDGMNVGVLSNFKL